jgi:hypothetical protein
MFFGTQVLTWAELLLRLKLYKIKEKQKDVNERKKKA